jgi:hypothetical protein
MVPRAVYTSGVQASTREPLVVYTSSDTPDGTMVPRAVHTSSIERMTMVHRAVYTSSAQESFTMLPTTLVKEVKGVDITLTTKALGRRGTCCDPKKHNCKFWKGVWGDSFDFPICPTNKA